ncbi:membrane lipoprotein lipid attachment site-containing protein [Thalassobacillus hwangdonensis]|uniref:Membrane lipoprotein lipid attachment site-containing protein n=1 Tax=Thalassobacillus hwangdonensis TaxID=546108 RepID=A0ABW3L2I4_9BACI
MKKFLVVLVLMFIAAGCSSAGAHHKELEKTLDSELQNEQLKEMDLNDYTEFEWDEAYIFPPYTTEASMEKQTGIKLEDPSGMESRDDINLIVFTHEGAFTNYVEISRKHADISSGGKKHLTPHSPTITITHH